MKTLTNLVDACFEFLIGLCDLVHSTLLIDVYSHENTYLCGGKEDDIITQSGTSPLS
jgi:hypothetical protein